jgi:hypothetical protein
LGPVPTETLKTLAKKGILKPTDLIWKEGYEKWVKAKRLRGLEFISSGKIPNNNIKFNNHLSTSNTSLSENETKIKIAGILSINTDRFKKKIIYIFRIITKSKDTSELIERLKNQPSLASALNYIIDLYAAYIISPEVLDALVKKTDLPKVSLVKPNFDIASAEKCEKIVIQEITRAINRQQQAEEGRPLPDGEGNAEESSDFNNTAPRQDNKEDTIKIFLKSGAENSTKSQSSNEPFIDLSASASQEEKKSKNNKSVNDKGCHSINKHVEQKAIDAINKWSRTWSRITIPSNIMNSSKIVYCDENNFVFITLTLNYSDLKVIVKWIPCATSSVSIDMIPETLFECRPILLKEDEEKSKQLELGNIQSCANCRGKGNLKCRECNGAGQKKCWRCDGHGTVRSHDSSKPCNWCTRGLIICSCGNGQVTCGECTGYGKTRRVFNITEKRSKHSNKFTDYKGFIPNNLILETTGSHLYSKRFEFPLINWQKELKQDLNCYQKVLKGFANTFSSDLAVVDEISNHFDFLKVKLNDFLSSMPNPKTLNEALKSEILPQSLDILIEKLEARTIKFRYKTRENISTAYVFGKEMRVHVENMPFAFTPTLFAVLILFVSAIIIPLVMSTINK